MTDILINSTIAGIFLSIIFGFLSVFVILRKLSFLGVGISHSAFAGVALALLLNCNVFMVTLIFCLFIAFFIGKTTRMGKIEYDNSIGLFFSFTMALGAIFIYIHKNFNFDIMGYLFGSILGINSSELFIIILFSVIFSIILLIFFKELIFITFDEEVAQVSGINVNLFDSMLLIILTTIIVTTIKLIGIILVSALLILPGSFALLFTKNYKNTFILSIIYCMFIYFAGFFISWYTDIPVGASIVAFGGAIYFLTLLCKK